MFTPPPPTTPAQTRVLVVSATLGMLVAIRSQLAAAGYDALQYHPVPHDERTTCEMVIEGMVQTFAPHLLVLDITAGKEDAGWQRIQTLQLQPVIATLPWVVCIAATAFAHEMVSHLVLHGIPVVPKPFTSEDLLLHVWAACPPSTPATLELSATDHREQSEPDRIAVNESTDERHQRRRRRRVTNGPSGPSQAETADRRVG